VVIISESVATRFFADEDPIGRRLSLGDTTPEIVGIVGDIRRASLTDAPRADLYFPFERVMSPSTTVFVRTQGDPIVVLPALQAAVRGIEPHAVLFDVRTLEQIAGESAAVTRLASQLLSGFAIIALLLAAIGVYGVMSYSVQRRTRELGTRLALGASPWQIVRMVLAQAGAIALIGLAIGTVAAFALTQVLSSVLYNVVPWDPVTIIAVAGLLGLTTLAASYVPAKRAARVDPTTVLASE
jgi:ABC-type antimicrobial peptide transport system permease subunit